MGARFIHAGNVKVVFAPSVANKAASTQAEINAGTVLAEPGATIVDGLRVMNGFVREGSAVDTPDVNDEFIPTIPGTKSAQNPSAEFYDESDGSSTIRTALAEDTAGFVVIMRYGQTTGRLCEVWPVTVLAQNGNSIESGNTTGMFTVQFAVTSSPDVAAVIAA